MKNFFQNVLASLVTAALIGNLTFLFRVNERLARLETIVSALQSSKEMAHK